MKTLLGRKWLPLISHIGFLNARSERVSEELRDWLTPILEFRGVSFSEKIFSTDLENALKSLLPITKVEARRYLILPTASSWTAIIDNGFLGTDSGLVSVLSKRLGCSGVMTVAKQDTKLAPNSFRRVHQFGAVIFEVYNSGRENLSAERIVSAARESKWVFETFGDPFSFEHLETYKKKRIKERFTFEMLEEYAAQLGLFPFSKEFYLPGTNNRAILVEKNGPFVRGYEEVTISD